MNIPEPMMITLSAAFAVLMNSDIMAVGRGAARWDF
jgi:hypothetical protein